MSLLETLKWLAMNTTRTMAHLAPAVTQATVTLNEWDCHVSGCQGIVSGDFALE